MLKRNCSLRPRQLAQIFAGLAALSSVIAGAFAVQGAWLVLPFAGIEVLALGVAFVVYARHAADYERIVLGPDRLLVETCRGDRLRQEVWSPVWTQVQYGGGPRELIGLIAAGRRVEVGRFVSEAGRGDLARELRSQLQGVQNGSRAQAWGSGQREAGQG